MKKLSKNLAMYIMCFSMLVAVFCAMTIKAEAANVTTGTLGNNNGITWTYDADTKTLTITGEDSGWGGDGVPHTDAHQSKFLSICPDVEVVILQNCKPGWDAMGLFAGLESLKRIEMDGFDTSKVYDMSFMFEGCKSLESLDVSGFDTSNVTDMSFMFRGCSSLQELDVSNFDTSNVKNMKCMFSGCSSVSELDVSDFNTSKVTDMSSMFHYCLALESLDVSGFDTANVTDMSSMFAECESLSSLDLSSFKPANVTDMHRMFAECTNLESLNLSTFVTPNLRNTSYMFSECPNLKSLNLSAFVTSNVYDMSSMFFDCTNLVDLDVSSFDTAKVKYIDRMFYKCKSITSLDLSNFDFTKVTNKTDALSSCSSLVMIKTPKAIPDGTSIGLGRTYVDLKNNQTMSITGDFCNTTLYNMKCLITEVQLSDSALTLDVGKNNQLSMAVLPETGITSNVKWKSSNTAVATVDAKGNVKAVAPGTATITVTATDLIGQKVSANCEVTVIYQVTGITLNKTTMSLHMGKSETLTATVSPGNATNKAVTWNSSDTSVAKVDTDGKVTAVAPGTVTITATAQDGSDKSASCKVTVIRPVTKISINWTRQYLEVGETSTLTVTVSPDNATNKAVTWKSSDTTVATVDANGKVTAVGEGTATITVTAQDGSGKSASCTIIVTRYISEQEQKVRGFVSRMYGIVLYRLPEEQGLNDWTARLMAKEIDGATLVDMFVNSDEFIARNTSDEEYIKILYRAILDREADAEGLKMWKDMLADGWTRDYILEGLVLSTEFKNICDSYGIIAAFEPTAESQVRSFVKRMYTVVLGRRADAVGLEDWTRHLLNGVANGAQVADGFINSQEFANRNLSDEKYVKVLYRAFFNREPDEGGFNVWMNELAKGTSRRDVMKGFVHSVEFSDLCAQYGIIRGEIQ